MGRLGRAMCFTVTLWAPLSAAASPALCAEPTFERVEQGIESQQATPEQPPSAAWLEALAPRLPADAIAPADTAPADDDVLWCATPDDPRCAPLPADTEQQRIEARTLLNAAHEEAASNDWPLREAGFGACLGLGPVVGVRQRLERPPQAGGREL